MQWIAIATPPFQPLDTVTDQVGDAPDGLHARYVGTTEDGSLRVVTLWESKAHADRFFSEKLGSALARNPRSRAGRRTPGGRRRRRSCLHALAPNIG